MKVCDRCGAEEGTCYHTHDEDYVLETPEEYAKGVSFAFSACLVVLALIAGCLITYFGR
jgi:hypothetical protein